MFLRKPAQSRSSSAAYQDALSLLQPATEPYLPLPNQASQGHVLHHFNFQFLFLPLSCFFHTLTFPAAAQYTLHSIRYHARRKHEAIGLMFYHYYLLTEAPQLRQNEEWAAETPPRTCFRFRMAPCCNLTGAIRAVQSAGCAVALEEFTAPSPHCC